MVIMPGTFFARIDELDRQVGHGTLTVSVEVDQVYAKYQELRDDLNHPRGGKAHALRDSGPSGPLQDEYLQILADHVLTADESDLVSGAIDVSERVCSEYLGLAPVEFVNLRRSTHPKVLDDGAVVYDRPPHVHRLSEDELRAQRRHGHALDYGSDTFPRL